MYSGHLHSLVVMVVKREDADTHIYIVSLPYGWWLVSAYTHM